MSSPATARYSVKQKVLLTFGFAFAALGYLNALPDFGWLPSLGVIRAVDLHAMVLAAGFFIAFLFVSNFSAKNKELAITGFNLEL